MQVPDLGWAAASALRAGLSSGWATHSSPPRSRTASTTRDRTPLLVTGAGAPIRHCGVDQELTPIRRCEGARLDGRTGALLELRDRLARGGASITN
jgi:hypothetical protein